MTSENSLHIVLQKVEQNLEDRAIPQRVEYVSLLAREAARQSARLSGLALDAFPKNEKGGPLPFNNIYWSLTHKPTYVGGAAARAPIGLDLEFKRPIAMKIYDRVASGKEWQLAINAGLDSRTAFFMVWTAKEAVLKRLGVPQGFYQGLSDCLLTEISPAIDQTVLTCANNSYRVRYLNFDSHLAAVCTDTTDIKWHTVTREGMTDV